MFGQDSFGLMPMTTHQQNEFLLGVVLVVGDCHDELQLQLESNSIDCQFNSFDQMELAAGKRNNQNLSTSQILDVLNTSYLKAHQTTATDNFGWHVAIDGDICVVGAINEDSSSAGVNSTPNESASAAGAAYVYRRTNGIWAFEAYLKPSNPSVSDQYGFAVAISGNTIAVGSPQEDTRTIIGQAIGVPIDWAITGGCGAVYIYEYTSGTWTQTAFLKAPVTQNSMNFGCAVAFRGNRLIAGAAGDSIGGLSSGAAYIFERSAVGAWSFLATLKPSTLDVEDVFGFAVDIDGDVAVVCAAGDDSRTQDPLDNSGIQTSGASVYLRTGVDSGAVYIFRRHGNQWVQERYLKANDSDTEADEAFGYSMALRGNRLFVGAFAKNEPTQNEGCVYYFEYADGIWHQRQKIKITTPAPLIEELFGFSVGANKDGTAIIIGARSEDSSGTGITSTHNDSASNSGIAYIFKLLPENNLFVQVSTVKASQVNASDSFGYSVAMSEDCFIVGAVGEDSNTTGVNSTPNESAGAAGAAYAFNYRLTHMLEMKLCSNSLQLIVENSTDMVIS